MAKIKNKTPKRVQLKAFSAMPRNPITNKDSTESLIEDLKKLYLKTELSEAQTHRLRLSTGKKLRQLKKKVGHGKWYDALSKIGLNREKARRLIAYYNTSGLEGYSYVFREDFKQPLNKSRKDQIAQSVRTEKRKKSNHGWCSDGKCDYETVTKDYGEHCRCNKCKRTKRDKRHRYAPLSGVAIREKAEPSEICLLCNQKVKKSKADSKQIILFKEWEESKKSNKKL